MKVSIHIEPPFDRIVAKRILSLFPNADCIVVGGHTADLYIVDVRHIKNVPYQAAAYVWPDGYRTAGKRKKPEIIEAEEEVEVERPTYDYGISPIIEGLNYAEERTVVAVDTETEGLGDGAELLGLSYSGEPRFARYSVGTHEEIQSMASSMGLSVELVWHNAQFDLRHINNYEAGHNDTMVMAWLCGFQPGTLSLEKLALTVLNEKHLSFTDMGYDFKKITGRDIPVEDMARKSCGDADHTFRLYTHFEARLKELGIWKPLYKDVEIPLIPILMKMKDRGLKVDRQALEAKRTQTIKNLEVLDHTLTQAGFNFNRGAPEQLSDYLFNVLKLPVQKATKKKGNPAIDRASLKALESYDPHIGLILLERELKKQLSTFLNMEGDEVHANFNQCTSPDEKARDTDKAGGTVTGRLSSSNPNLQQIPLGFREIYVPRPGYVFVGADYSQAELRIASFAAGEERMLRAFREGRSVHEETAQAIGSDKALGKKLNFTVIYGGGVQKVQEETGFAYRDAEDVIYRFFSAYPSLEEYIETTKQQARRTGLTRSLPPCNRVRFLPDINSGSLRLRAEAERQAVNTVIQGTCADIGKSAMIDLDALSPLYDAHLVLAIHDELVYEVPESKAEEWLDLMMAVMVNTTYKPQGLILEADGHIGRNWKELKG